ncbi:MAG: hypothetical protein AAF694_31460, partial [Bacteroidota bacterium]
FSIGAPIKNLLSLCQQAIRSYLFRTGHVPDILSDRVHALGHFSYILFVQFVPNTGFEVPADSGIALKEQLFVAVCPCRLFHGIWIK